MRIVDVQQILMQEPRVSWKAAQLITHPEFQKEINRQRQIDRQRKESSSVMKTERTAKGQKVASKRILKKHSKGNRNSPHFDISV